MKNEFRFRTWFELTINEKLSIKQTAMNVHGKRVHWKRPDHCNRLNELQVHSILSAYKN